MRKIGTEINITPKELKNIISQYKPNDDEDDDRLRQAKTILENALEESDYIIYCLYLELNSERQLAALLNVSRTPVHRLITNIKEKIEEYKKNYKNAICKPIDNPTDNSMD